MATIDITTQSGAVGNGDLQLQNGAPMDATLRFVTDALNTASPLKLSTSLVQTTSTLKITTNDNPYIDAEDGSGNNRFTVGRDSASQQVNVDFASNPAGSTTIVGAIRTFTNGVSLAEVMSFREDGNIGINTSTPGAKLDVHSGSDVVTQFNRTGSGKSLTQYLLTNTAKWATGFDNTNGNYIIRDDVNAADRMVVTNAGNVGIGTTTITTISGTNPVLTIGGTSISGGLVLQRSGTDKARLYESGDLFIHQGMSSVGHSFYVNASTEAMRITSTGNVGINETSPTATLNIKATSSNNSDNLAQVLTNSEFRLQYRADDISSLYIGGLGSERGYLQGINNTQNAGADISLNPYGGNVGIGTSTPSANLEVSRSTQQTDFAAVSQVLSLLNTSTDIANNATGIRFRQDNGTNAANAFIGTLSSGSSANRSSLVFAPANTSGDATERMRITATGNVGIGTTAPENIGAGITHVAVSGSTTGVLSIQSGTTRILSLSTSGTNAVLQNRSTGSIIFSVNGGANEICSVTSNGLTFNGDTAAANALDDYEEGVFSPTIIGSVVPGTANYTLQQGRYTKIGRQVSVQIDVEFNSGTGTGDLQITGLPFSESQTATNPAVTIGFVSGIPLTANNYMLAYLANSTNRIDLIQYPVGGTTITSVAYSASGRIILNVTYLAN